MNFIKGLLIPTIIMLLWLVVSRLKLVSFYIMPPPEQVFATVLTLLDKGVLLKHLSVSFYRVISGFLFSFLLAFPLAVLLGINRQFEPFINPPLEFVRHIPPLACIPLLILWFGIGEASKLAVIILAAFFPIFLNTINGIRHCDQKLLEVGDAFGLSACEKFLKIILPATLPFIIIGMRLGLGYSWRALIGAELVAASAGIGYMILDAEQISRSDIVIIGILTIGTIGYIIDYLFLKITQYGMPWVKRTADS
ncbi:ABC transporter permease [Sporomusa sp.]|uniref:ABC transporter permease n=1 Tax=Sporomusa sp. TaxID=2078658 RepID=UPI002B611877|nr:ABC transporter permease [Sporomusa sp.]HWR42404.1 ABC transporter permease [Sporomusa sp.]